MNNDFYEDEDNFLRSIVEDGDVTLMDIIHDFYNNGDFSRSLETSLDDAFAFIGYLAKQYSPHFHCTTEQGTCPIVKTPGKLVTWLKETYYGSKDREIAYGIWFELDREAIPPEYLEEADEAEDTTL
jgi:hypothetical protein